MLADPALRAIEGKVVLPPPSLRASSLDAGIEVGRDMRGFVSIAASIQSDMFRNWYIWIFARWENNPFLCNWFGHTTVGPYST